MNTPTETTLSKLKVKKYLYYPKANENGKDDNPIKLVDYFI